MSKLRAEKVGDQMKRELASLLQREVKDPRIPLMTGVSAVEVSSDLSHATCFMSVLGSEEEQKACLQALEKASGFLRSELAKRIRLRISPELHFRLDDSIRVGMEMSRKIDEVLARDAQLRAEHGRTEAAEPEAAEAAEKEETRAEEH